MGVDMKTYIDFLKERLPVKEGTKFSFIDLICEPLFEDAAEAYHEYRMAQYKKQFYCRKGKIQGERCKMQCIRCSQIDSNG